jgi:hypothetical protein
MNSTTSLGDYAHDVYRFAFYFDMHQGQFSFFVSIRDEHDQPLAEQVMPCDSQQAKNWLFYAALLQQTVTAVRSPVKEEACTRAQ